MRDWSTLRQREWQPCTHSEDGGGSGGRGAHARCQASSRGSPGGDGAAGADAGGFGDLAGPGVASRGSEATEAGCGTRRGPDVSPAATGLRSGRRAGAWRTDTEISSSRATGGSERSLQRWEDTERRCGAAPRDLDGTLEELSGGHKQSRHWDQFKANEELFGVVSTFKADLSQYTTPLNMKRVPQELRRRAERIAQEMERPGGGCCDSKLDGLGSDGEGAEEEKFSAVPRSSGSRSEGRGHAINGCGGGDAFAAGAADREAGGALLASLRAAPRAVNGEGDYRSLVAPKVQGWWRARQSAGAPVPPGAEDGLVCPFSQRVFGDVSQLVMHWATALPRAEDRNGETATPSLAATEQFRRVGRELRWSEMMASTGLGAAFSVEEPRPGSVWAQVLSRLQRSTSGHAESVTERFVGDFVNEALLMKCWRRDQKVQHREVLEGLAAGLALHALDASGGLAWRPDVQEFNSIAA